MARLSKLDKDATGTITLPDFDDSVIEIGHIEENTVREYAKEFDAFLKSEPTESREVEIEKSDALMALSKRIIKDALISIDDKEWTLDDFTNAIGLNKLASIAPVLAGRILEWNMLDSDEKKSWTMPVGSFLNSVNGKEATKTTKDRQPVHTIAEVVEPTPADSVSKESVVTSTTLDSTSTPLIVANGTD